MRTKNMKRGRLISILAIIIGLLFADVGASSQSITIGGLFAFILVLGIDGLMDSFKEVY